MLAKAEDAELVVSAKDGDRPSFGELYERHRRMVHGILLARVPHRDVEDLVQTVFLQAFQKIASLRQAEAFGGWLAVIARNAAHDYHRRSKRSFDSMEEYEPPSGRPSGPEAAAILNAIRLLPDAYCETLILRLVEGMTGPEIAAQTGLSPGSVRVNLCRGMKLLREHLGAKTEDV